MEMIECSQKESSYKQDVTVNPLINATTIFSVQKSMERMYYGAEIPELRFTSIGGEVQRWCYNVGDYEKRNQDYQRLIDKACV